jgi:hypothetical protein
MNPKTSKVLNEYNLSGIIEYAIRTRAQYLLKQVQQDRIQYRRNPKFKRVP